MDTRADEALWITTGELAEALRVSTTSIHNWVRAGVLTPIFVTPGGHYRFVLKDARQQVQNGRSPR